MVKLSDISIKEALRQFYRLEMPFVTGRGPLLEALVVSDPRDLRQKIRVYISSNSKDSPSSTIRYSLPIKNDCVNAVKWSKVIELCKEFIERYTIINEIPRSKED